MLFRLLAHKERRNRMALEPGQLRDGAGQRDRAHFQPADIIKAVVLEGLKGQLGQQCRAFRIQHGRFEVEVEIALAP